MDIEYKLRFFLNSTLLTVNKVEEKDRTGMELLMFLKKYKNQKMIHAFVSPQTEGPTETPLFGVPIDDTKTHHKVLYCQIAVGTPLFASEEYATNCKTPKGYDSFIISKSGAEIENVISEFKRSPNFSLYRYVVPDSSRVLVLAEVEFTYDRALEEKSRGHNQCEFCKESQAISFCLAERASFCDKCDRVFHANEFTQRHERYYFKEVGKKKFFNCQVHKDVVVGFFCTDCKVPVCTQCRIFGSHSEAPNSKHELLPYIDACDKLKLEISNKNEVVMTNLKRAQDAITEVDKEIADFEGRVDEIKSEIDYNYRSAINTLNDLVKRRYQKINARYFESIYLEKIAQRASEYPKTVDPSVLVEKWTAIEDLNRHIEETVLSPQEEEVPIKITGSISIELAFTPQSSPASMCPLSTEDELSRQRTEMLLRASQFRTRG
ncbi:hypothetical protein NECID01_0897 [Nematocida sp. AWRm77]|nr:hypothetical protein NECID01_0897 [Nematocida sp. AWRm77]